MTYNQYKQLLDIIADEVNVKEICIGIGMPQDKEVLYNRKTRIFHLGLTNGKDRNILKE